MENRLDRGDYIELHIFGAMVLDFLVYKYLFKYIPSLTYRQSFFCIFTDSDCCYGYRNFYYMGRKLKER